MTKDRHSLWTVTREPDKNILYLLVRDTCADNNTLPFPRTKQNYTYHIFVTLFCDCHHYI